MFICHWLRKRESMWSVCVCVSSSIAGASLSASIIMDCFIYYSTQSRNGAPKKLKSPFEILKLRLSKEWMHQSMHGCLYLFGQQIITTGKYSLVYNLQLFQFCSHLMAMAPWKECCHLQTPGSVLPILWHCIWFHFRVHPQVFMRTWWMSSKENLSFQNKKRLAPALMSLISY